MTGGCAGGAIMARVQSAVDHGWLKRPELRGEFGDLWEMPDGTIITVPHGKTPCVVTVCPGFEIAEVIGT